MKNFFPTRRSSKLRNLKNSEIIKSRKKTRKMMTEVREPENVNGINVEELKALIAGVAENPGNGTTNWRVSTSWQGQTRSRARVDGFGIGGAHVSRSFSIDIDEPCELGGTKDRKSTRLNSSH